MTAVDIRPRAEAHLTAIAEGRTRLLAGFTADGRLAATAFLALNDHPLMRHWAWLYTVMVDPALQGRGYGADLLREAEDRARALGLEGLRLTCRGGGTGTLLRLRPGYKEIGLAPDALRVAPGDDRDEITMLLPLPPGDSGPPARGSGRARFTGRCPLGTFETVRLEEWIDMGRYTLMRLGVFAGCLVVVWGLVYLGIAPRGLGDSNYMWIVLLALVISAPISFVVLRKERDRASAQVVARVDRMKTNLEQNRSQEDGVDDATRGGVRGQTS